VDPSAIWTVDEAGKQLSSAAGVVGAGQSALHFKVVLNWMPPFAPSYTKLHMFVQSALMEEVISCPNLLQRKMQLSLVPLTEYESHG
jgi:hypothetical protein